MEQQWHQLSGLTRCAALGHLSANCFEWEIRMCELCVTALPVSRIGWWCLPRREKGTRVSVTVCACCAVCGCVLCVQRELRRGGAVCVCGVGPTLSVW